MRSFLVALPFSLLLSLPAPAQKPTLTVDTKVSVSPVSPTLYGLMTEDINGSFDGGLYPELLNNSTVEHSWQGFEHWRVVEHGAGRVSLQSSDHGPSAALAHSMRVTLTAATPHNEAGVANEGFVGIGVQSNTTYSGSFYARSNGPNTAVARLVANADGAVLAETRVALQRGEWQRSTYALHTQTVSGGKANHFELLFTEPGNVELQLLSLLPPTYHSRPNGLRPDLMQMLAAMHPKFLRLPGGNFLEGDTIGERFDWKKTIGARVDRPGHRGPWGYRATDSLGLLELLEWCEDLHIEPVLAVYAGYSLHGERALGKDLEPFIQEDLDEIEYVSGDSTTRWGAQRARDGHPAPFALRYVEIGNEDNLDTSGSYSQRFPPIAKAIRARYPGLQIIATEPVQQGSPDVIDDHYYASPEGFFAQLHKYDTADRHGPKVFVGEWATREGTPTPDFGAALGDAAWMTSMERNSDIIVMAAYAPMLVNVSPGAMQWSSDLIGFDAASAYGSPSYWAQMLFASHLGDHTVHTAGSGVGNRFFWSATVDSGRKLLHLKLVNAADTDLPLTLELNGCKTGEAESWTLHAASTWATNSITRPTAIQPQQHTLHIAQGEWSHTVQALSIEVLDVPLQ